jgi:hypothetical protein
VTVFIALAMCVYKIALFATHNIDIGPISGMFSILFYIISIF